MKWLTLELIKQQSRISSDFENDLLTLYGEAAEETIESYIDQTYEEVVEQYGEFPAQLKLASLMLTDASYNHRTFATPSRLENQGAFDRLVKPYMILPSKKLEP